MLLYLVREHKPFIWESQIYIQLCPCDPEWMNVNKYIAYSKYTVKKFMKEKRKN